MPGIVFFLLTVFLLLSCISQPKIIEIINPEFEIVSIVILQADIVVTEVETTLKVTNPNDFAIELSSLTYELFGNGAAWAAGKVNRSLHISPQSSGETKFKFEMNFVNMSRRLLDDVIAMRRINYRLKGQAQVQPAALNSTVFNVDYDCSGVSEVKRRTGN